MKGVSLVLIGISILLCLWVARETYVLMFPDISGLIPIEQVEGGDVCKSSVLVKNINTEDQVVLRDIIYQKSMYLGTHVSPGTVCSKIFYGNIMGGYGPPTAVPTTTHVPEG